MNIELINDVKNEVERRCFSETNPMGAQVLYHIKAVVKNAEKLADLYNADKEVVLIAAWLHDVASITDKEYYEEHNIYGANIAQEILEEKGYPQDKLELVKKCIRNHRRNVVEERTTKEEICVTDADAISHFDNLPALFFFTYMVKKKDLKEGIDFVREKLGRSYQKLSEESQKIYKEKYDQVMEMLKDEENIC